MTTPSPAPQRTGLPLAIQMIAIMVFALIAAQAVTLGLTVLLPPIPPPRWSINDVVQALSNHSVAVRLDRKSMSGPPDVSGEGWLVSESSRAVLASKLGEDPRDVVLAFYTQLPVGGVTVPTNAGTPLSIRLGAPGAGCPPPSAGSQGPSGMIEDLNPAFVERGSEIAQEAKADAPISGTPQPIPFRRDKGGLFALASPPFMEGDFIAAARQPNGKWLVVAPAPLPFPNMWQQRVMLWFIISLLVVSPIVLIFVRRIVNPLRDFAQAAEQLGRDPTARILPLSGPAEVGRAAHAFNQMRHRVRAFVEDRTAMVGAISHDLRTPALSHRICAGQSARRAAQGSHRNGSDDQPGHCLYP